MKVGSIMFGWYKVEIYSNGSFSHTLYFKFKSNALVFAQWINDETNRRALVSF